MPNWRATSPGRWCASVQLVFLATGRLLEKYDVAQDHPGGGGEYETQSGLLRPAAP